MEVLVQKYRAEREVIRQRHAGLLDASSGAEGIHAKSIRTHPRWQQLVTEGQAGEPNTGEGSSTANNPPSNAPNAVTQEAEACIMGPAFIPSESTVRNDYAQRFIDTQQGELPGNAVRNPARHSRFVEYPKLRRLIDLQADLLDTISIAPTYLRADLLPSTLPDVNALPSSSVIDPLTSHTFRLTELLPIKYDVAIIDPPLEAYEWEGLPHGGHAAQRAWSWDQVVALPMQQIMAKESFVFLWVGSGGGDGLERGREALARWGYRRCEDIVWVRTNDDQLASANGAIPGPSGLYSSSAFHRTVQHCLMGIRGTVRRSTDTGFVHCNIDTDVILWPGEQRTLANGTQHVDLEAKPPEMMDLIENFCQGTRRIELFGRNRNLRRGWLTVGLEVGPEAEGWSDAVEAVNVCAAMSTATAATQETSARHAPVAYDKADYQSAFYVDPAGCTLTERANLVPYHEEIDALRPKSPKPQRARGHVAIAPSSSSLPPPPSGHQGLLHDPGHVAVPSQPFRQDAYSTDSLHSVGIGGQPLRPYGAPTTSAMSEMGGAGLSGLGAGGRSTVSIPSGSESLSGAQAHVLLSQTTRSAASQPSGPNGLGRRARRPL